MTKTTILIYLSSATALLAHPGHGAALPADTAAHWIVSPAHGLGVIALAAGVFLAWRQRGRGSGHA